MASGRKSGHLVESTIAMITLPLGPDAQISEVVFARPCMDLHPLSSVHHPRGTKKLMDIPTC